MNKYPEIQLPETKKLFEIPSNFVFKDLIYLLESQSNREGKTKKTHLLVHYSNGCNEQIWAKSKPGA